MGKPCSFRGVDSKDLKQQLSCKILGRFSFPSSLWKRSLYKYGKILLITKFSYLYVQGVPKILLDQSSH